MYIYNVIAHILTLTRILLTPVFASFIYHMKFYPFLSDWAKIILIIVAISDWLDGYIAKKWGGKSRLGTFFDPIADKIFLDTSIIVISITYDLPIWVTVVLVGRDVGVMIVWSFFLFVSNKKYEAKVHVFGKLMIVFQIATIASAVFSSNLFLIKTLCIAATLFSIGAAVIYLIKIDNYRKLLE
jgi:CDP-diacylglycerol---glycerol-3-phosphate 3-phosphatidyltransferase